MSRTITCPKCLRSMPGLGAALRGSFEITNVTIGCPNCGHMVPVKDGRYTIINGVIEAFMAPGMTREKAHAAKLIIEDVSGGTITTQDAIQRLEAVSGALAKIISQSQSQKINWEFLLALFALIYTIWNDHKSDADAQAALAESRTQTEVAQKMLAESQVQSASLRELATKPNLRPQVQGQTNAPKNRAERRKEAAIQRQGKPPDQ